MFFPPSCFTNASTQAHKGGSPETHRRLNKSIVGNPWTKFLNLEDRPKFRFGPHKTVHGYMFERGNIIPGTTMSWKWWQWDVTILRARAWTVRSMEIPLARPLSVLFNSINVSLYPRLCAISKALVVECCWVPCSVYAPKPPRQSQANPMALVAKSMSWWFGKWCPMSISPDRFSLPIKVHQSKLRFLSMTGKL